MVGPREEKKGGDGEMVWVRRYQQKTMLEPERGGHVAGVPVNLGNVTFKNL